MTAGDTARNHCPSLQQAGGELQQAGEQHDDAEHLQPCCCTSCQTRTVRPAAGPLTCSGEPRDRADDDAADDAGDDAGRRRQPEASEMPMHSGSATRKTTIDARKSRPKVADEYDGVIRLRVRSLFLHAGGCTVAVDRGPIFAIPQRAGTIDLELQPGKRRQPSSRRQSKRTPRAGKPGRFDICRACRSG